ncbi:MAG: adenylyltransferase [Acidobacteriaceae bacterium]|nr:adenylyltransferase [Acidobacteriaceae bacterium]
MNSAALILAAMDHLWTPWRYAYVTQPETGSPESNAQPNRARPGVTPALAAWPGDRHCVFCNLVAAADYAIEQGMAPEAADRAANIVLRGPDCYVCLNSYPYATGHVMVVPYVHEASLAALAEHTAQEMMALAQRIARALEQAYHPDGMNLGLNQGKAAGAGVAGHLHLHALPRWLGDTNFMTVVGETRVLPETLEQTWERLHAALTHS